MDKLKLLNVDDSAFMRKLLMDIFSSDENFSSIAQATNGKEALEILKKEDFDVITLDIQMPIMDGIETLKQIMEKKPTPVVMLSTATKKYAKITFDALEIGAVDFISKPSNIFTIDNDEINSILHTVKSAAKSNKRLLFKKPNSVAVEKEIQYRKKFIEETTYTQHKALDDNFYKEFQKRIGEKIILIGTSTGGPRALQEVIPKLPKNIGAPILIVQHMPEGFTKSLSERLNTLSKVTVKEAEDGEQLKAGIAYIAPGGYHLEIKQSSYPFKIKLTKDSIVNGHRPSVDVMFNSVASSNIKNIIAVVMTGMGADGARGLKKLKTIKNAVTIAEDESTCVVNGMPKSAIETGKVDKIVPLNEISFELNKLMGV